MSPGNPLTLCQMQNRLGQQKRFFVSLLYLEILSLSTSKNVRYYWKCSLAGKRYRALKVLFQVCILKESNYTHINSFVRTKHVNCNVRRISFFNLAAACCKSTYVEIKL